MFPHMHPPACCYLCLGLETVQRDSPPPCCTIPQSLCRLPHRRACCCRHRTTALLHSRLRRCLMCLSHLHLPVNQPIHSATPWLKLQLGTRLRHWTIRLHFARLGTLLPPYLMHSRHMRQLESQPIHCESRLHSNPPNRPH